MQTNTTTADPATILRHARDYVKAADLDFAARNKARGILYRAYHEVLRCWQRNAERLP